MQLHDGLEAPAHDPIVPYNDLPTGIVTFRFTDLEGHTRIVERFGDRYAAIEQRHDATVRSAIASGEGREEESRAFATGMDRSLGRIGALGDSDASR